MKHKIDLEQTKNGMIPFHKTNQSVAMGQELKYADITEKIIGCAMHVHRKMKAGYSELIYSRCSAIEFDKIHLAYKKEFELPIWYDEITVGKRRIDFMVDDKIVVEL